MNRRIIGIVGVPGSGKILVSNHLQERYRYTLVKFSAPVRRMLQHGLGLSPTQVDGDRKDTPDPELCWKTPRGLQRYLISDFGRKFVGPGFWCGLWKREVMGVDGDVLADDVLRADEAAVIRSLGGEIWKVFRPGLKPDEATEATQRGIEEDHLLMNATTIPDLLASVDALVTRKTDGD
jgi:hypothetical protein